MILGRLLMAPRDARILASCENATLANRPLAILADSAKPA